MEDLLLMSSAFIFLRFLMGGIFLYMASEETSRSEPVAGDFTDTSPLDRKARCISSIHSWVFPASDLQPSDEDARLLVRGGGVGPSSARSSEVSLLRPRTDTLSEGAMLWVSVMCEAAAGDAERWPGKESWERWETRDSRR